MTPEMTRLAPLIFCLGLGIALLVIQIAKEKPSWITVWSIWVLWLINIVVHYGD